MTAYVIKCRYREHTGKRAWFDGMIQFDFNKECYGCGLCAEICPVGAIRMVENKEGFKVPVVDTVKCVGCNKCDRFCIRLTESKKIDISKSDIYAFYIQNVAQRVCSTSGGAFYALAKSFIEQQGVVCGCVWNAEMEAEIVSSKTMADIKKMRGSKYVQSDILCFSSVSQALKDEKKVLFSGVPCQVAAAQKIFGKFENFYTVALLCEGTASPKAWQKYKTELETAAESKMINALHRQKGIYGWISPMAEYVFENGERKYTLSFTLDEYVHNMIYGYFTRNSCYSCQFKGKGSTADIMIGDFWGLPKRLMKKSKNKGCSVILVNTEKGKEMFSHIDNYYHEPITLVSVQRRNPPLLYPAEKNGRRDAVLKEMDTLGFHNTVMKYCNMNTRKVKIQRILHKLRLVGIAKKILRG